MLPLMLLKGLATLRCLSKYAQKPQPHASRVSGGKCLSSTSVLSISASHVLVVNLLAVQTTSFLPGSHNWLFAPTRPLDVSFSGRCGKTSRKPQIEAGTVIFHQR